MPASTESANRNCQAGSTVAGRGPAPGGSDGVRPASAAACLVAEQPAERLAGRRRSGRRASPSRRRYRSASSARTCSNSDRRPARSSASAAFTARRAGREVGVGPLAQDRQPAVGRAVEPPQLEVEVAQPIGGVVADRRDEVRRVDPLEVLQLRRALGLVEQLLGLGVVEEPIGRLAGRRQRRQDRPPLPLDRDDEAILAVDEPARLVVGDRVERLRAPAPRPRAAGTARSRRSPPWSRSRPAASAAAGRGRRSRPCPCPSRPWPGRAPAPASAAASRSPGASGSSQCHREPSLRQQPIPPAIAGKGTSSPAVGGPRGPSLGRSRKTRRGPG